PALPLPSLPAFPTRRSSDLTFHHLPREDEVGPALLHFRASEGNFISFAEAHAHVVEEGLRAKVYVDCVRPVLHQQVRDLFRAALDRKSTRLNSSHQIISYAV